MKRRTFLSSLGAAALASSARLEAFFGSPADQPQFGMWIGGDKSKEEWQRVFARMRKAGMTMVLPNIPHEKLDALNTIVPLAANEGLDVHVWRVVMLNADPLKAHPEWYGVSRSGISTAVKPPYVDYYRFLCPSRPEVQEFLRTRIRALADVPGIKSVHLDYIRFPDVILPVGLWKKYHLVQDKEYPDFDFCYCQVCRDAFRAQTGLDPLKLADPPANEQWLHFRWQAITSLVGKFHDDVHARGKLLTAAVFPTPTIARKLVRQDWVNWNIDAVMPMMYHNFYEKSVGWIGAATQAGVRALRNDQPLYSGVYIPALTPAAMRVATNLALHAGAGGVVYFDEHALTAAHWDALRDITSDARSSSRLPGNADRRLRQD